MGIKETAWGQKPSSHGCFSPTQASASARGAAWVLGKTDKEEEVPGKGGLSLQAETRAWVQKTQAHWLLLRTAPVWFHGFITRR